jgi:hypothetical protein
VSGSANRSVNGGFWDTKNDRSQPEADGQSGGLGGWQCAYKENSAVGSSVDEFSFLDDGLCCVRCQLEAKLLGSRSEEYSVMSREELQS